MYSDNFHRLLDEISEFMVNNNGQVWFRGVPKLFFNLKSSLYRLKYNELEDFTRLEDQQLRLLDINSELLKISNSEIEKLYIMQHYGMRTRLLDWTRSLGIALYFISLNWSSDINARLWLLNPCKLNELSGKGDGVVLPNKYKIEEIQTMKNSMAIYPIRNNKRIVAQHGYFTIQGNTLLPLDEEFDGNLLEEGYLKHIDLSYELKNDVMSFLDLNDINDFTVFPDMDGLKTYVDNRLIESRFK